MVKSRVLIATILFSIAGGCSINNVGFVSERYFENETSYLVTREAWGGSLSTKNYNGGLALGHRKITLAYPKDSSSDSVDYQDLARQVVQIPTATEIDGKSVKLEGVDPYAWLENNQGLVFNANRFKFGFSLGLDSRNVLVLPPDFDGVVLMNQGMDGNLKATIRKINSRGVSPQ